MIRSSQKPTCFTFPLPNAGTNKRKNTEHSSNPFRSLWFLFPWTLNGFLYAKSHLLLFPLPFVKLYISSPSHQVGICCFLRLKLQFFFLDAANFSVCFLLAIYRAICLQSWLEETLQFFFSLLLSAPSYISEMKVFVCITSFVLFALRHNIFTDENLRWKVTRLLWLPSWWNVGFGKIRFD